MKLEHQARLVLLLIVALISLTYLNKQQEPGLEQMLARLEETEFAPVLVQFYWEYGSDSNLPFQVPVFSLCANGELVYLQAVSGENQAMQVHLTQKEVESLWRKVLKLGFEELASHTDYCSPPTPLPTSYGQTLTTHSYEMVVCVKGGAQSSILRARLPSGELKEVKNYDNFANRPEVLESLRSLLGNYSHPDAQPYLPEKMLLLIERGEFKSISYPEWPLDPMLLEAPPQEIVQWALVLDKEQLRAILDTFPDPWRLFFTTHKRLVHYLELRPLPGFPCENYAAKVGDYEVIETQKHDINPQEQP